MFPLQKTQRGSLVKITGTGKEINIRGIAELIMMEIDF